MKFREAVKILQDKGYTLNRVRGSHYVFVKDGKEVIVCKHSRDIAPFIKRNIEKAE
jgi:predicted RNA binding protein YcfA (HicA-like mRNA interferase family)